MSHSNEEILYRIISGKQVIDLDGVKYIVKNPSNKIKLEAEEIFKEIVRKNRFNSNWITDKFCLQLLVSNGLCTADVDSNMKKMEKSIEDLKVSLYTSLFTPDIHKKTKKTLDLVRDKQANLVSIRHSLDHLTVKGYASMVKNQFIIFNTLFDENENRVWENIEDIDVFLLEKISYNMLKNTLPVPKLRELSRTEPWRSYWSIKKTNVFDCPVFDLTDEQKSLILFSKMYDSAHEHPECPTEEVLSNDDLFDGWMIMENRKREKQKMTSELDKKIGGKRSDSDEVFLVAKSKEDRDRIEALNDAGGSIIKAQRLATIKKQGGKAVDANFVDRRVDMQQQANQQFMNTVKKGK